MKTGSLKNPSDSIHGQTHEEMCMQVSLQCIHLHQTATLQNVTREPEEEAGGGSAGRRGSREAASRVVEEKGKKKQKDGGDGQMTEKGGILKKEGERGEWGDERLFQPLTADTPLQAESS